MNPMKPQTNTPAPLGCTSTPEPQTRAHAHDTPEHARLIAAAPQLLAACRAAYRLVSRLDDTVAAEGLQQLRAAIAAAGGAQ